MPGPALSVPATGSRSLVADTTPLRHRRRNRALMYVAAVTITLFMMVPLYLITLAAFSSRSSLDRFPLPLLPTHVSGTTMSFFLTAAGVRTALENSVIVGVGTLLLSLLVGVPAGYAVARYAFRGRDAYQLFILLTRALPIIILAVPLSLTFTYLGIYDSLLSVMLAHTMLAMPTTVLITASIFVAVPKDVEEAALVFGCSRAGAFRKVVVPLALPGVAASSIFTFVLSWNEVFAATILTLTNRTLPAQLLSTLNYSPLAFRFAGGFALVLPSMLFILVMRRYLFRMWGSVVR